MTERHSCRINNDINQIQILTMKRTFAIIAAAIAIASCAGNKQAPQKIAPLPAGYSTENIGDCTFPAAFSADDFNWRGSNLTLTVYGEAFYDAAQISSMKKGDTLVFDSRDIIVESILKDGNYITVNGGVEEGGAYLQAGDGGTWRGATFDDHSIYNEMGEVELLLDDDFRIIDCGIEPTDPIDTVTFVKPHIDYLEGARRDFIPYNTRVRTENGMIKEIVRRWIP